MMTFRDIPGRNSLKSRLAGEIREGKPGHAYIFEGPEGCGKKEFAIAFAHMLLCTSDTVEKPCGECRHCSIVNAGGTGELYIIEEKKSISIKSIRELQDNIYLLPVCSKRKVYIILNGDNMTRQAQNCILKTLEEPPEYAHIIITASNSDKFIDTIKSRSVIIQVGINSIEEITEYLGTKSGKSDIELEIAAQCAFGSIGKALEILESKDFNLHRELTFDFIKNILEKNYQSAYDIAGKISKNDTSVFFAGFSGIIRDMIVYRATGGLGRLINIDKKDIIMKGANRYLENVLVRIAFITEQAADNIAANASKRQTLDAMIVRITEELAKW